LESEELYQKRLEAFQKVMLQFNDASIWLQHDTSIYQIHYCIQHVSNWGVEWGS
jgi:hypothetical protein